MKIQQFLKIVSIAIAVILLTITPAFAEGNQSNQALNQPATLIAPDPDFQINIYPKPNTSQRRLGYGLSGDRVVILQQVGSNEGFTWSYVQFEGESKAEGWVREDFIAFNNTTQNFQKLNRQRDRYLGSSSQNTVQRNRDQRSSQQQQYQQQQY